MRHFWFALVVLYAGCLGHCFWHEEEDCSGHAGSGGCVASSNCDCPLTSALHNVEGTPCQRPGVFCSDGAFFSTFACTCDSLSHTWQCTQPDDFAFPSQDFSSADIHVKVGCGDYQLCLVDCIATVPNANQATCSTQCAQTSSPAAVAAYDAAITCLVDHCVGDADAASGECVRESEGDGGFALMNEDGTPLSPTDPGTGQKRCNLCLHDAEASLTNQVCTVPNGADCNPTECQQLVSACLLD